MSLQRRLPLVTLLACALPFAAAAQTAASDDPYIVIARTVEPRVAYRGFDDATDNPIRAQAPLFPAAAFGRSIDGVIAEGVDDDVLRALGAGGVGASGGPRTFGVVPQALGFGPAAQGSAPAGLSGAGGAIGHATSGIGGIVTSTLSQALGNLGGHP